MSVIPNAVDSAVFRPVDDGNKQMSNTVTIVIGSRLVYRKGELYYKNILSQDL